MNTKPFSLSRISVWHAVLVGILGAGLYSTYVRFFHGLGASTALRDGFPWGLWIGFDVLCGVALAGGGFTVGAAVYVFHADRFKPIIRPTILTAFLGYMLVVVGLMFDLGHPWYIWHAIIMWNPHSVMFEVAWCVMLYSTVLALEFSPILFEGLGFKKAADAVHQLIVPLVVLGVLLSMLHQSSLGSLFLILPGKLHPLWYSPLLPIFFFISAVALGCGMTIFESFLSYRVFRKRIEMHILSDLGKVMAVALMLYLLVKYLDMSSRGVLGLAFQPTYEGRMFLFEMMLGVVAPLILLLIKRVRNDEFGLFTIACMVVLGIVTNRLNVATTGLESYAGRYFPSWMELSVTAMIVACGFVAFGLAVKYLPVFPKHEFEAESRLPVPRLPFVDALLRPAARPVLTVLVATVVLVIGMSTLAYSGLLARKPANSEPAEKRPDVSAGIAQMNFREVLLTRGAESPGQVTFNHASHVDTEKPSCVGCHSQRFRILKTTALPAKIDMHDNQHCGSCHDGKTSFSVTEDCETCHSGQ